MTFCAKQSYDSRGFWGIFLTQSTSLFEPLYRYIQTISNTSFKATTARLTAAAAAVPTTTVQQQYQQISNSNSSSSRSSNSSRCRSINHNSSYNNSNNIIFINAVQTTDQDARTTVEKKCEKPSRYLMLSLNSAPKLQNKHFSSILLLIRACLRALESPS